MLLLYSYFCLLSIKKPKKLPTEIDRDDFECKKKRRMWHLEKHCCFKGDMRLWELVKDPILFRR